MTMKPDELNRLFTLLGALRDEIISEAEFAELNALLDNNEWAQEFYLDYIYLCTDLCNLQAAIKQDDRLTDTESMEPESDAAPFLTFEMLQVLGDYERKAKTVTVPKPAAPARSFTAKVPVKMPPRKLSKLSLFSFAASLAAILFVVAYVHLVPRSSYAVATLLESVDAQWSSSVPLQKGIRLSASSTELIALQKGVIELESDKGVLVTLEGPAEFSFISPDEIVMNYGRLFAAVPQTGSGFSVQTLNSKVIDLGTNFGVYADTRGDTELHVFKGNTVLIAGQKGQNRKTVEVSGGQARRIDSVNGHVTDIALDRNLFARGIDPKTGLLITGGKQIDLADIVGGGDGTGTGGKNQGIEWDGSRLLSDDGLLRSSISIFPKDYIPVAWSPFIDGVFIPNSKGEKPQQLTSSTSDLDLDAFVKADTNGLLTLILVNETTDLDADYWFSAKESADDPEHYPTLTFPASAVNGPVRITTSMNNGADAYVANDTLREPMAHLGAAPMLSCRYLKDRRIRIIYLRFDINGLKGNLSNGQLSLYLNSGNRFRNLHVYGLKDGEGDFWDERTISFETAPGLLPAAYGNYQLDKTAFDYLGTFAVVDNRIQADAIAVTANRRYRWNAPNTQCLSESVISNSGRYLNRTGTIQRFILGDVPCGTEQTPSVAMHANAGITFDLDAIRREQGPVQIESFTATCGISQADGIGANHPAASFYVLVNGSEVFSAVDVSTDDMPQTIEIALNPQAHYLTLAATQGTDHSTTGDLCLFVKPALILK